MKKFNLKKVTAAVSAAAMISTMGTAVFADTVTDVTVKQKSVADGVYTYTITYPATTNVNGASMLAYGTKGTGENDPVSGVPDDNKYANGMRILGVNQNDKDATSFELVLTTKENANGYYVQAGKPVVVAVNSTGTPMYALAKTYVDVTKVSDVISDADDNTLNVTVADSDKAANGSAETVKAAAKSAVEAKLAAFGSTLDYNVVVNNPTIAEAGTATATYTAKVPVIGELYVNDTYYKVPAEINVTGTVTVPYEVVVASTYTADGEKNIAQSVFDDATGTDVEKIQNLFKGLTGTKVTLTNGDVTDTLALVFDGEGKNVDDVTAVAGSTEENGDKPFTVTVKLTNDAIGASKLVKVGENATAEFTVKVTAKTPITKISGEFNTDAMTVSKESDWTNDKVTADVLARFADDTAVSLYKGSEEAITEVTDAKLGDFVLEAKVVDADGNDVTLAKAVESAKVVVTAKSIKADSANTALKDGYVVSDLKIAEVAVSFQEGTPVYLGDVNLDGTVNGQDWMAIMNHLSDFRTNANLNNKDSVAYKAANINGDDTLNGQDWMAIMNHLSDFRTNSEIGTKVVGYKPAE